MYREHIYPLLCRLDAEHAHNKSLLALRAAEWAGFTSALGALTRVDDPRLAVDLRGLRFANPVGLAAGFDKNGVASGALAALGFGHVEIGTVTPRPQSGRPTPRIFRLTEDDGLINRMGFPNWGMESLVRRLAEVDGRDYVRGINIGPNLASVERGEALADYTTCLRRLAPYADYLTINVSSPNTQGLRALQGQKAVDALLSAVFAELDTLERRTPILIKIAPDLDERELCEFVDAATRYPLAGIIATNTALFRPATLKSEAKEETGGLSGQPLRERSTEMIRAIYQQTRGTIPIVGVGGVFTAEDALEKIRAGASLVQIYTGFIYGGPLVVQRINEGLVRYMDVHGVGTIADLVGKDEPLPSSGPRHRILSASE